MMRKKLNITNYLIILASYGKLNQEKNIAYEKI